MLTALLWLILLGWISHLWSIIDAALYRAPQPYGNPYGGRYSSRHGAYSRYY